MDFCVGTKEKFSSRVLSTLLTIDRLCLISGLQSSQYTLVLTWTLVALQYLQTRAFKFEDPVWIQDAQGRSCDVGTRPDLQGFFFFLSYGDLDQTDQSILRYNVFMVSHLPVSKE